MILFLQFTLTDLRSFTHLNTELLHKPQWPSPKPFAEFVRSTGEIVERNKGGIQGWVGENFVCKIGKAIRFPDKLEFSNGLSATNISKHLYANSQYVMTKFEFVFNIRTGIAPNITHETIKSTINDLLNTTIKLKINGRQEMVTLNTLSGHLRQFHYQNSSVKQHRQGMESLGYILSCTPQFYFYLERSEWATDLKKNFKHIENIGNFAELYGSWYNHRKNPFRIWIHHRKSKSSKITDNRELRMTILRLHSQYECLRNILWSLSKVILRAEPRSQQSDRLQSYFNSTIKSFLLDEKSLEYQSYTNNFFNYFSKIFAKSSPGDLEGLLNQIETFRPNIKDKIVLYITKNEFMNNKFENYESIIVSQGDNNIIQQNEINQNTILNNHEINFEKLLIEVSSVLDQARIEARETEHFRSVAALSEVKDAIEKKDNNAVVRGLKSCGKFALDIANKMTASILLELFKSHTNLLR